MPPLLKPDLKLILHLAADFKDFFFKRPNKVYFLSLFCEWLMSLNVIVTPVTLNAILCLKCITSHLFCLFKNNTFVWYRYCSYYCYSWLFCGVEWAIHFLLSNYLLFSFNLWVILFIDKYVLLTTRNWHYLILDHRNKISIYALSTGPSSAVQRRQTRSQVTTLSIILYLILVASCNSFDTKVKTIFQI